MKHPAAFLFLGIIFSQFVAAQNSTVETRIQYIEDLKIKITADPQSKSKETLNSAYKSLEASEYMENSLDGQLELVIGDYDTQKAVWPLTVSMQTLGHKDAVKIEYDLPYSDVIEKKYVLPEQMTERQLRDYEFNVEYYDALFRKDSSVLYAELYFTVTHWLSASEYRIKPVECRIYKNEKRAKEILTLNSAQMQSRTFVMSPQIDVRSAEEYQADIARVHTALESEKPAQPQPQKESETEYTEEKEQKGRLSFYVTTGMEPADLDFSDFDIKENPLDSIDGYLTWGMGKNFFTGLNIGYDINSLYKSSIYSVGVLFGGNLNIGSHFRPYADTKVSVRTDNAVILKAGGGFDIIMGNFMLNIDYGYNWKLNDFESIFGSGDSDVQITNFHAFSIGAGFTW